MSETKFVNLKVDRENLITDLKRLIPHVRADWIVNDVQFKESLRSVETGCMNTMVTAFLNPSKENAVMFRIYRLKDFDEYFTREREVCNVKLIHNKYGFAPNVILKFANGFCYDYIHGEIMTPSCVIIESNWRLIAQQIALLNSTQIEEEFHSNSKLQELMTKLPDVYPESLKDPAKNKILQEQLPTKTYVQNEMKQISDIVESLDCKTVFCHHDLKPENMVWNKEIGTITFVDFELASFGRQAGEIAYHFWRITGLENNDYSKYPEKDFQLDWLRLYLKTYNKATKDIDLVNEEELDRLYIQVNVHYLLYLIQMVCGVCHIDNFDTTLIPIDLISMAVSSYEEYRRRKSSILALLNDNVRN